jgi:glycosyltransferase involved in cell wall biosynthesis
MIEVLHLIDTARIGGPGKTIINSARFIDPRFRVHVGAFTHADGSRHDFASAVTSAGIPLLALPETRRVDPAHIGLIRTYVREQNIAIVHAHGYRSDVISWLATRGTGVTLVTTHHGWIRNNWRQLLFTRLAARLSARFEGIEVVSRPLLEELPPAVRASGRVEVVHNAIVLDDYRSTGARAEQRRQLGLTEEHLLLGVVGRLSIEKGCLEMVDAFGLAHARHPNLRLAFVGEGPLDVELRRRVDEAGIQQAVQFVPHQREVRPVYEGIDILVCPSRTEGLSNVIMEAMAFGRPVVATRVGGNPELVDDGATGRLVEAQQPEAMANAIVELAADDRIRGEWGRQGQVRVREAFSFEARMRREERFYTRAIARRAGGA